VCPVNDFYPGIRMIVDSVAEKQGLNELKRRYNRELVA